MRRLSKTRLEEIVFRRRAEEAAGNPTAEGGALLDLADECNELREELRVAWDRNQRLLASLPDDD